jgi:hypothetical protein
MAQALTSRADGRGRGVGVAAEEIVGRVRIGVVPAALKSTLGDVRVGGAGVRVRVGVREHGGGEGAGEDEEGGRKHIDEARM